MAADTQKLIEQLQDFVNSKTFESFKWLYRLKTGEGLKTFDQLVEALESKLITPQDIFEEKFNQLELTEEEEDYWLSNLELFDYENYFPSEEKQAKPGGIWIKVRTEKGFQIHLAKKATRKLNFFKESKDALESLIKAIEGKKESSVLKAKNQNSLKRQVQLAVGLQPYELWYWKTKTQKAYVTPFEYDVVDIQEFIDHVQDKSLKGVLTVRSLFTSENKDKVLYLQQRGISQELARIFANLSQCYFDVNVVKGMEIINDDMRKAISSQLSL